MQSLQKQRANIFHATLHSTTGKMYASFTLGKSKILIFYSKLQGNHATIRISHRRCHFQLNSNALQNNPHAERL